MGAVAVIAGRPLPDALLPVVVVDDVAAALGSLADAFYERPSRRMRTVGVVGSYGKTTTAWLSRGMFEETAERCGMIGGWAPAWRLRLDASPTRPHHGACSAGMQPGIPAGMRPLRHTPSQCLPARLPGRCLPAGTIEYLSLIHI